MKKIKVLLSIFLHTIIIADSQWIPKILWTYWDQPLSSSQFQYYYHLNRLKYAKGWDVRLLNKYTFQIYLNQIPGFQGFPQQAQKLSLSHKANYVRTQILAHFGGVWIDYSTIMTQTFDWINLQNLVKNPDVYNIHGNEPEVLLFTYNRYQSKDKYINKETNQSYIVFPGYEIWFLAAKPKTKFFNDLLQVALEALNNKGYMHNIDKDDYLQNKIRDNRATIKGFTHYLLFNALIQILIQTKQKQLDANLSSEDSRQLSVWYYNIWHIKAEDGPFSNHKFRQKRLDILLRFSQKQANKLGVRKKYFIKLIGPDRDLVHQFFTLPQNLMHALFLNINLKKQDYLIKYLCPSVYGIHPHSIIAKHLIGSRINEYDIITKQQYQSQECVPARVLYAILLTIFWGFILLKVFGLIFRFQQICKKKRKERFKTINAQEQGASLK